MWVEHTESPIGRITLVSDGDALTGLYMADHKRGPDVRHAPRADLAVFRQAREQLAAYFAGELRGFDLPLRMAGTPFQRRVWERLRAIPHGETVTYGELAARVGAPDAARAVGAANGRNPVSIIVPCHRVVGAKGALTGYAGGVDRKRWLLTHEEARIAGSMQMPLIIPPHPRSEP